MKAAILYGPYDLRVEETPIPVAREDEVLVRVKTTAVCGTDISIFNGKTRSNLPVIQGHESAGIVVENGKNVTRFNLGDKVIINPAIFCDECYYCKIGLPNLCVNGGLLGRDRAGTFAQYCVVPQSSLTLLPDEISFEDASSLQALATVLRAWERMSVTENDCVAVIGLGTPGLLHTRMSVISGAKTFAMTRSKWKLDIAASYGATPLCGVDAKQELLAATCGRGADLVIEAAGTQQTTETALSLVRPGGTIMLFGVSNLIKDFDVYQLYYKELSILGSRAMNTRGYERAVELYVEKKVDLSPLITKRFALDEISEVFSDIDKNPGKSLRTVCNM